MVEYGGYHQAAGKKLLCILKERQRTLLWLARQQQGEAAAVGSVWRSPARSHRRRVDPHLRSSWVSRNLITYLAWTWGNPDLLFLSPPSSLLLVFTAPQSGKLKARGENQVFIGRGATKLAAKLHIIPSQSVLS
ncbi:hypothetical protein EYF80_047452 [Liparis tanakae]|uniref:Uncharacterized protein n=1 Tax=Liparis tanakae TaxID=230148 RepID=A0A4Z2FMC5_9TELE|nr:hypothetical protein EYF80_047452 [Liparis tanakae]